MDERSDRFSRRGALRRAAGLAAAGALGAIPAGAALDASPAQSTTPVATRRRIKQSLVWWCYRNHWDLEGMCKLAKELGCSSIELIGPEHWATLKQHGLVCAITGSHGFTQGMNNPAHWDMCIARMRASIDACAEAGFPNVITFTGFREDIPDDVGLENCVRGYKKIVGYAEEKKVTLCLEMLNSRVDANMKGHPGYQGDHVDYCIEILRRVGSERLKLLFDIYHVQIMDGDIIVRLRQYKDFIGHYHTAGNPGRGELDDVQEINYPAIMKAIVETGYTGHVGQEFIPTRDARAGLEQAVRACDV